ncbi:SurA N-terminal domain-containing protein [Arenimonas sp. MALMAid1274]|uniref:SurA N-terminal domain-containing protein n=1 Tax=Arenimonas sp. MALMAid1274 TaxID=3411630 RepID=UPI003BA2E946
MLQNIREKKWIAFVILVPVIIAMAFFGVDSYFSTNIETFAARIQGPAKFMGYGGQEREISQDEFRRRFDQVREQERQRQGESFDSLAFESLDNKRQVLDAMVDEALLALVAERDGITVSELAAAEELKALPQFQVDGKYSPESYRVTLAGQGTNHAQFMAGMRADMARRTVPAQIIDTALTSDAELEAFLKLSRQTRDVSLLDLPTPSLPAEAPSDADLQAWYDANASRYRSEEQVALEYVEIDGATLEVPTTVDEATLRGRYEDQKARYTTAAKRVASHLLVAVPADADAAAEAAARERIDRLAEQARLPGADFAALARENSDDLGSKAEGGDLGEIQPGVFPAEFEAALNKLDQAGQVSEPVRTPDGWHLVQLREFTPGTGRSFEEVRGELETEYLANERDRVFSDLTGELIDLVYQDPTALAPAAEKLGLPLQRTGLFSRREATGIAALPAVREAAFSEAQRVDRQVSDTIEIGPNQVVVIHVVDVKPEAAIPLADVRDRVLSDYNADRLAKASKAQAEALLARAEKGETLDALATEVGRTVATLPGVNREAQLPPSLIAGVFRLPAPEAGKPSLGVVELAPDRHALVSVTAVTPGDLALLDDQTRLLLRGQFAQARGLVEYQDFIKSLRKTYTITVAEDRL